MRWLRAPISRIGIGFVAVIAAAALVSFGVEQIAPATVAALASIPAAIGAYVGVVRWLEQRRRLDEFAPGRAAELAYGLVAGGALFGATMLVLWLAGAATFVAGDASPLFAAAVGAAAAAVTEELVFRGFVFRILEAWRGPWLAFAISAAFFGAAHLFNPNASVVAAVAIALEAGVLLGAAYLVTRRLWLPIGLHAAWNFTESGVFGTALSGHASHGLVDTHLTGSDLVTGGAFGPEASIAALAVCLVASAVLLVLARRRSA